MNPSLTSAILTCSPHLYFAACTTGEISVNAVEECSGGPVVPLAAKNVLCDRRNQRTVPTPSRSCAATICFPRTRLKVMAPRNESRRTTKLTRHLRDCIRPSEDGRHQRLLLRREGQVRNASFKQGLTVVLKERLITPRSGCCCRAISGECPKHSASVHLS